MKFTLFGRLLCILCGVATASTVLALALQHRSAVWLPAVYGVGTGLPVVVFAFLVSAGVAWAGAAFRRLQAVERWARYVTAAIVIAVGVYYTWTFTIQGGSSI